MTVIRFDPYPKWKDTYLSTVANMPQLAVRVLQTCSKFASSLPQNMVDSYLQDIAGVSLVEDRELARGLLCNPEYAKNFLNLGMQEIRDIPRIHDVSTVSRCTVFFLDWLLE